MQPCMVGTMYPISRSKAVSRHGDEIQLKEYLGLRMYACANKPFIAYVHLIAAQSLAHSRAGPGPELWFYRAKWFRSRRRSGQRKT